MSDPTPRKAFTIADTRLRPDDTTERDLMWRTWRAYHARNGGEIVFPVNPEPRDIIAKILSHGLNLWVDWHSNADEILERLAEHGYRVERP